MRRREVIGLLTAAALPVRAWAQNARKVYRLGVLAQSSRWLDEVGRVLLLPELARQGFVEGSNLVVDFRSGADENLEGLAGKLVERAPDAILTIASPPTRAARTRTSTVPIVLYGGQDAVAEGFAETLARPGGNVTGVVIMSVQLEAKRLQLLNEAVPAARRITALLYGGDEPLRARQTQELQTTAAALNLELQILSVSGLADLPAAFAAMTAGGAEALLIGANARLYSYRAELLSRAFAARLPTVCEWGSMAREGCLLGYGPDREALYRNAATKLVRLFQGAAPADLPVEQPAVFSFAVNLQTARSLGIELPAAFVARSECCRQ
jgi:putative tryptophan/tyrosine transport system substrate-binding protein